MYAVIIFALLALEGAILLLVLMRVAGKRDEAVTNMEAAISVETIESTPKSILLPLTLFLVLIATLILAIWVRLTGAGWGILIWGIPLLLVAILHFTYQITAIRRVSEMEPSYILLILLSDLFLFLGFALQADVGDAPGSYVAIAVFYEKYFQHGSLKSIPDGQSSIYLYISIGFLIALIVSWFFLLGKSFLKRRTMLDRSH